MFEKTYSILSKHIDFQNVVDDLYFAFYMEWCRHAFMEEVVCINVEKEAASGNMYVLLESKIKFKKPLLAGQQITVTCEMLGMDSSTRFGFHQKILLDGAVHSEGEFIATFLPKKGRPHIPEKVIAYINK